MLFSSQNGQISSNMVTQTITPPNQNNQEVHSTFKLFIGGTVDRPSSSCATCQNFNGYLYKTTLHPRHYTTDFGLAWMFESDTYLPTDPIEFRAIDDTIYASFYIRFQDSTDTLTFFELGASTNVILSLRLQASRINVVAQGTSQITTQAIASNTYYHIFLTVLLWEAHVADLWINNLHQSQYQILPSLSKNIVSDQLANDFYIKLGDSNRYDVLAYQSATGSYFSNDEITNCKLSTDNQCLLCNNKILQSGKCKDSCDQGYYLNVGIPHSSNQKLIDIQVCLPCDRHCSECSGPSANQCIKCQEDYPAFMNGYCLLTCPLGTTHDEKYNCHCDTSCTSCDLDATLLFSVCLTCVDPTKFISQSKCVEAVNCPLQQYGNPQSKSCVTTCSNPFPLADKASRMCTASCPNNSILSGQNCDSECPHGTYGDTNTKTCLPCVSPCLRCEALLYCTSCNSGQYAHEVIGACGSVCQNGFVLQGNLCRICQVDCSICPPNYYISPEKSCVTDCPLGYEISGVQCEPIDYPLVIIKNKEQFAFVGRRNDLLIETQHYLPVGQIASVQWTLNEDANLYKGTTTNQQFILIPKNNLKPDTQYNLKVTMTADNGKSGFDTITIQTSQAILNGTFTVTHNFDSLDINYSNFQSLDSLLYFDCIIYQQSAITINQHLLTVYQQPQAIFKNRIEFGQYTFPFALTQPAQWTLQFIAHTLYEQITLYYNFTISTPFPDHNQLQDQLLLSTVGQTINQLLYRTQIINYFHDFNRDNETLRILDQNIHLVNHLIHFTPTYCDDLLQCRGFGLCSPNFYNNLTYQCDCYWDKKGDFCTWQKQDLVLTNELNHQLLNQLLNTQTTQTTDALQLSSIALNLVKSLDALSVKSYDEFSSFIDQVPKHSQYVYINLFDALSHALYLTIERTSLRPDDKARFSLQFIEQFLTLCNEYENQILSVNTLTPIKLQYVTILFYKSEKSQILSTFPQQNNKFIIALDKVVFDIPIESLPESQILTITAIQWNFDPVYSDQFAIGTNSYLAVKRFGGNIIDSLNIDVYMMKKTGYPPLIYQFPTLYACNYRVVVDNTIQNWKFNDQCKYISENELYIKCTCSNFGSYQVAANMFEFDGEMPFPEVIQNFSRKITLQEVQYLSSKHSNTEPQIELSRKPYEEPIIIVEPEHHEFVNLNFILSCLLLGIYTFIGIVIAILVVKSNLGRYITHENDVYLLTFHPILSLSVFGQTNESHTYLMRFSKFVITLHGYVCFLSVAFRQFIRVNPRLQQWNLIFASVFFSLFMTASISYLIEGLYYMIRRHLCKFRHHNISYCILCIICHLFMAWFGVYTHGFLRESTSQYILALVLLIIIDLLVFDSLIVCYSFCAKNNDGFLQVLAFRGFYLNPSSLYVLVEDAPSYSLTVLPNPVQNDQDLDIPNQQQQVYQLEQEQPNQHQQQQESEGIIKMD